jgi:TPR repeat protein
MRRIAGAVSAAALTVLMATPLHAQGTRRGLEPRSSAGSGGAGFGTYHAIIFAVGDQQPSSGLPSLRFPLKEADSLRAVITREYTFDPKNVQVVKNPTREAILDSLEAVARRLGPDDNLLVVYSGHGGFDEAGKEGYWLAADAANARKSTWIPNESIRTWLRTLKARSVLLITDACFSGSLNRSNDDRVDLPADNQRAIAGALMYARRSSRQAMTAGTAKETVPQVSIFSMEIVAALKHRRAPVFMAQQLAAEINPRVAAVAHTTPTFSAVPGIESDQGDFVFVRREGANDVAAAATPVVTPTQPATGVQRGGGTPAPTRAPDAPQRAAAPTTPATTVQRPAADAGSKTGNIGTAPARPATGGAAVPPTAGAPTTPRPTGSIAAPTCDGGVASGCVTLGLKLEKGTDGQTRNVAKATEMFRTACDVNDPAGCMNLGRMYDSRHDGVSMDRGKARQYFTKACDGGNGYACTALGIAAQKGEGGPVDDTKASLLLAKGCDGGSMQGCGLLGIAYANGKGVTQDEVRGRSWMQAGCNGNDAQSCNALAQMHANGKGGVPRDSVKAITFWKQACTSPQGVAEACANLGAGYLKGAGVMRDDVRAGQYLSQGCEGGVALGCTLLASMYETGTSVTAKSVTRAAEFYKRGCDGKNEAACAWITAHPQALPQPPKK